MAIHYLNATPAASAATIDHAIVQIWNPTGQARCRLLELSVNFRAAAPAAGAGFYVRRSNARGTAGSTVTPTAAQHRANDVAAGFLLDLAAFSVQPTLVAGDLCPVWSFPAVISSGVIIPIPHSIEIEAGAGLVFCNIAAVAFAVAEWGFTIEV
jgi:hypothetical protein